MRHVSRRHCSPEPTTNVRYKSAYFQIPSAWLRTKAALYMPPEAQGRMRTQAASVSPPPTMQQCDVVMVDEDANKGRQEVTD